MKKTALFCFMLAFAGVLFFQQTCSAAIDPENIVGIWTLEDSVKGGEVQDLSANGFVGIIKGGEQEDGKIGKCLDFGKGDTVEIALGKGTITEEVTVVMWLKFTDLTDQQNYYSIYDLSDHRYVPYKTAGHELHFWSNNWDVPSGTFVKKDEWNHVANVADGTTVSIYINGELGNSQAGAGFALADQQQTSWLATDKGGWISACTIDDVGLFNVPLGEQDIRNIFNNGVERATGFAAVETDGKLATTWANIKK